MKRFWIFKGLKFIIFATLFVLVGGYVIMSLWNWLIPSIFNGPIGWTQAIGILILGRILFGGFGHRGGWGGGRWGHRGWGHHDWKQRMENRMANMTPEQKEQFKAQMKERWGRCGYWCEEKMSDEGTANTTETPRQ